MSIEENSAQFCFKCQKQMHADGDRDEDQSLPVSAVRYRRRRIQTIGPDGHPGACIRRIYAQLIRSTELEIDKRHLDADGMTDIMFTDRAPGHLPWARPSI